MIEKLQTIIKTRETVKGLPIDYGDMREEFDLLLQTASGKKLVPREVFENETAELKEMNRALQFDRFGKLEKEKKEFLKWKLEFEAAAEEKLLAMAASLVGKGEVHLMWCPNKACRTGVAIRPGADKSPSIHLYTCPRCKSFLYHISTSLPLRGATVVVRRGF